MILRRPTYSAVALMLCIGVILALPGTTLAAPPQYAPDLEPVYTRLSNFPGFDPRFVSTISPTYYLPLQNPSASTRYELIYDYPHYTVTYTTTIGQDIRLVPVTSDIHDFVDRRVALSMANTQTDIGKQSLVKDQKKKAGGLFQLTLPIKSRAFESIFGEGGAGLQVSGYRRISFTGRSTWDDKQQTAFHRQSKFPTLEMEQIYSFDISGNIGSKISVNVNQDSRNDLPLANRLILRYKGGEDDVLQSVEAGNTTLSLPSTEFLRYSTSVQGLFGLKATAQIADVSITAIASQEKGSTQSVTISAGTSSLSTVAIRDTEYRKHTIYDLGRKPIPRARGNNLPEPDKYDFGPGDSIVTAQVYIDVGSTRNDLQKYPSRQYYAICYIDPTAPLSDDPDSTHRYEKRFELMSSSSYYINRKEEYLEFLPTASIGSDDVIGVYMQVYRAATRTVETIGCVQDCDTLRLKLIKELPQISANNTTWDYEWKNVYSLGGTNINVTDLQVDIYKGSPLSSNQPNPDDNDHQNGVKYLEILGLDLGNDQGTGNPDGQIDRYRPIIDANLGYLVFPDRHPFATRLNYTKRDTSGLLGDSVSDMYNSVNGVAVSQASKYYLTISAKGQGTSVISLNANNIIEGSEVVKYGLKTLVRDVDYQIDYDFGRLTLLKSEYSDLNSNLQVSFETAPLFALSQKTLFGTRLEYAPNKDFKLGTTILYKSNKSNTTSKPKLGEETSKMLVWDADFNYRFESNLFTKMIDALPLIKATTKSYMQLSGELAQSRPNPNVEGQVYIDDFEGSQDSYSLGITRTGWRHCSRPAVVADSISQRMRNFCWFNPLDQVLITDIWPNRQIGTGEQQSTNVLEIAYMPETHKFIADTAANKIDSSTAIVPENSWNGLMRNFNAGTTQQLVNSQLLELRIKGDVGIMHIDLGQISNDINGDGKQQTEDYLGNRLLYDQYDYGLDGVFDPQEVGYDSTNGDPDGDDWSTALGDKGYPWKINGTEKNASDPDIGYIPDTEVPEDGQFSTANNYFSYKVDLSKFNDSNFYVAGTLDSAGWKTIRIPLREPLALDTVIGTPSWDGIKNVRVWFDSASISALDKPIKVQIAAMDMTSMTWADSTYIADSLRSGHTSFSVASVNNEIDRDYTPPPGVTGAYDQTRQVTLAEQSLLLSYTNLNSRILVNTPDSGLVLAADTGLAVRKLYRYGNYLGYRTLEAYVHGHNIQGDSVMFFFRLGSDKDGYYEYRTILKEGWNPENYVKIDFDSITGLKGRILERRAKGDSIMYLREGKYAVKLKNNLQDPTLTRIQYFSMGVINQDTTKTATGTVWIDELRLTNVRNDIGMAGRISVSGTLSDFANYSGSYSTEGAYYRGAAIATTGGSDDNLGSGSTKRSYSFNAHANLDKLFPRSLELKLPIDVNWSQSVDIPLLERGTDIIVPADLRNDETSVQINKGFRISENFNKKTKNILFTGFLNRYSMRFSYSNNRGRSSEMPISYSENYTTDANYSLGWDKPLSIPPLFWLKPLHPPLGLSKTRLYLLPQRIDWSGSLVSYYSKSLNSQNIWNPSSSRLDFRGGTTVGFKVFDNLTGNYSTTTNRDLKDPRTVNITLNPRDFRLGLEQSYTQGFKIGYNPKIFNFLTHSVDYSVSYGDVTRLNTQDTVYYHGATMQNTTNFNFTFNHQTLFGTNKSKATRGVRKETAHTGMGSVYHFGLTGLRHITDAINPIQFRWMQGQSVTYPSLADKAAMPFRFGLTRDPGVPSVNAGSGMLIQSRSANKSFGAQSGLSLLSGVSISVNYSWSQSESFDTDPTRASSTTWPDVKLNFRSVKGLWLLGKLITYLQPSSGITYVNDQKVHTGLSSPFEKHSRISYSPLISFSMSPMKALRTNVRITRSKAKGTIINETSGLPTNIVRNSSGDIVADASYSFSSPTGIRLPLFGRLKFQSSMTTSISVTYNKTKDETASPEKKFAYVTTGEKSSITISPTAAYNFSTTVKGGLTARWIDSKDVITRLKSHTRELSLWVEMRF